MTMSYTTGSDVRLTSIVRRAVTVTVPTADDAPRVLDVRLVAWNQVARVSDDGRTMYEETWEPGSLVGPPADTVAAVYAGHLPTPQGIAHGALIGRVDNVAPTDDGLYAELVLADTTAARETWELARIVGATVSIEADAPVTARPGQRVVRTAAAPVALTGCAVLTLPQRGAIPGAAVLAARAQPDPGGPMPATLTDDPTNPDAPDTPDPAPAPPADPDVMTISRAELAETMRRELVRARLPQLGEAAHPLAQYHRFSDFAIDALAGGSTREFFAAGGAGERPLGAQLARAWIDQITGDNPGVMPPAWIMEVFGIVDHSRPLITGIGTRPLPESGMEINWPYFDGNLADLVAVQAVEKTEIASVKVSLKKGTTDIETFGGGSDLSLQLIRRSSPSYREAYLRIMTAAYALRTDVTASTGLVDLATGYVALAADATVDVFRAAVFAASVDVETATGQPASVILAATDQFIKYGSALLPAVYGTQNVSGTADASTLTVSVSNLAMVHARYLPAGTIIVTNQQAASWCDDGPFTISALDVPKLGEDHAVWGMGALMVPVPAGVVVLAAAQPAALAAKSSTAKAAK